MKTSSIPWLVQTLAGSCALGLGLGLVRFDFAVVGRLMLHDGAFTAESLGQLSSLNLAGYLLGCAHHAQLRKPEDRRLVLWVSVVLVVLSLGFEAFSNTFTIHAVWRVLAGWSAGHLMSGIPGIATATAPKHRRRRAASLVMAGAGSGALLGSFAIALLAPESAHLAWLVLMAIGLALAFPIGWLLTKAFPQVDQQLQPPSPTGKASTPPHREGFRLSLPLVALVMAYFFVGAGQIPVVLYEPLRVSEKLGADPLLSSASLSILGFGCSFGALLAASFPIGWSTRWLLPIIAFVGLIGNSLFLVSESIEGLAIATFFVGAWIWLNTSLTFHRLSEMVPASIHGQTWALTTMIAGVGASLFSFVTSPLANSQMDKLIQLGIAVMLIHLAMDLLQIRSKPEPKYAEKT